MVRGMRYVREIRVFEDQVGVSSAFFRFLRLLMMVSMCGKGPRGRSLFTP